MSERRAAVRLTHSPGDPPDKGMDVVRLRHPGRLVVVGVVVILCLAMLDSLVRNPRFHWDVVGQYLTAQVVLDGLLLTLQLTLLSMVVGVALGVVLAVMRLSANPVLRGAAALYVWFFRATPVLVQLLFWYFLASVYPQIEVGFPFLPAFASFDTNALITPLLAAVLGFGLNEAAYMSEIVRGGISSVDPGQTEAAKALGMPGLTIMRRVILPQAMKVVIPPTANEAISMLKTSSVAIVIALPELLTSVQIIYSRNFMQVPLLIVASIWYLVMTTIATVGQHYLERRFSPEAKGRKPAKDIFGSLRGLRGRQA